MNRTGLSRYYIYFNRRDDERRHNKEENGTEVHECSERSLLWRRCMLVKKTAGIFNKNYTGVGRGKHF